MSNSGPSSPSCILCQNLTTEATAVCLEVFTLFTQSIPVMLVIKDGLPYLLHSFGNKYFNKISLGNMLCFQNKL